MKITPLSDFVLIEPLKEEKTTASGIIIPETAQEDRPQKG
ncbi:TPA: co-chaperone GroES, partial [Patescibacteria group bacterium]|nr:co-chaperone GroES [Patescibacteria group bacterium]